MNVRDSIAVIKGASRRELPAIEGDIPCGDMPGDKVTIYPAHIEKADIIFPQLLELLPDMMEKNPSHRAVISVCGGSGVGKSGAASVLSYYFNSLGVGCYTLSGDNYPRRIPKYNDAERLHIYRESGLKQMLSDNVYTAERFETVQRFQEIGKDADTSLVKDYPWFTSYLTGGRKGLEDYLGTPAEIGFNDLTEIVSAFKNGANELWLKRMGRTETALWYDKVDVQDTSLLVIEWTHGNSDYYHGVDIPILLNSTPQETLEYRKSRNRDGETDSPFTTMVLEIEQRLLHSQAHKAKIIIAKDGEILSYKQYCSVMEQAAGNFEG